MNLDAECHLRITETTDCGCVPVGMARTDSTVPIKLTGRPVFGDRPLPSPNQDISEPALLSYDIDLRINGTPAPDVPIPAHCMVELWVPVTSDQQPADDNRRPGDIMTLIAPGAVEPGTRPDWN